MLLKIDSYLQFTDNVCIKLVLARRSLSQVGGFGNDEPARPVGLISNENAVTGISRLAQLQRALLLKLHT